MYLHTALDAMVHPSTYEELGTEWSWDGGGGGGGGTPSPRPMASFIRHSSLLSYLTLTL